MTRLNQWERIGGRSALAAAAWVFVAAVAARDASAQNGACCLADDSCIETDQGSCLAVDGAFFGAGTTCAEVQCAVTGACCQADGTCTLVSAEDCEAIGIFQGAGASCAAHCPGPPGPAFTYQGRLKSGGAPLNSTCDFEFSLWGDPNAGSQLGVTQTISNVTLADGLFTVELNGAGEFGPGAFNGRDLWLGIAVRSPAGSGTFTPLSPRQPVTAAPYALLGGPWQADGTDLFYLGGDLGLGTADPSFPLHVRTTSALRAIYALHAATSGAAFGVWGETLSPDGEALRGVAQASQGVNKGVRGHTNSPDGYGGYFSGPAGSRNYFERDVGIGTTTPGEALDVVGNATITGDLTASNLTYASAKTRYLAIPCVGFRARTPNMNYNNSNSNVAGTTPGQLVTFLAPLYLPHGAKIIGYEAHIEDSSSNNVSLSMLRQAALGTTFLVPDSAMASTGTPGITKLTSDPLIQTVDNLNEAYVVQAQWTTPTAPESTTDVRLYHVNVSYTVTDPLP